MKKDKYRRKGRRKEGKGGKRIEEVSTGKVCGAFPCPSVGSWDWKMPYNSNQWPRTWRDTPTKKQIRTSQYWAPVVSLALGEKHSEVIPISEMTTVAQCWEDAEQQGFSVTADTTLETSMFSTQYQQPCFLFTKGRWNFMATQNLHLLVTIQTWSNPDVPRYMTCGKCAMYRIRMLLCTKKEWAIESCKNTEETNVCYYRKDPLWRMIYLWFQSWHILEKVKLW